MAKNTTNQTAPVQSVTELEQQETHAPRALTAADFRPFFPESSGNCVLLWGANSLEICEDKGFKPTIAIPYTQDWLNFVSQKIHITISDSFKKADNELETFTSKKTANVYGGYLITCSLNGTLERANTNFYRKQTGKDESGKAKYGNTTEAGLERVVAAMSANDLSPATYGQGKKTAFVWAKFIQSIDEQTKEGGPLHYKLATWIATKKKYPTVRLQESAILALREKHGLEYWLTKPLADEGYVDPEKVKVDNDDDLK